MMREIAVDPERGTARAEGGVLLGELDAATQQYGLAAAVRDCDAHRSCRSTLGGGIGWLMRKYGLTIDQLMSVDLVTADGQVVTASERQIPTCFGGSAVAAATSASWSTSNSDSTRPDQRSWRGRSWWDVADSPQVLRFYHDWINDAPDELTTVVIHRRVAAVPTMPVELHGRRVVR